MILVETAETEERKARATAKATAKAMAKERQKVKAKAKVQTRLQSGMQKKSMQGIKAPKLMLKMAHKSLCQMMQKNMKMMIQCVAFKNEPTELQE